MADDFQMIKHAKRHRINKEKKRNQMFITKKKINFEAF